jgi:hypothetical protein
MIPLIPIISGLTSVVPAIAKWIGGDKAEDAASKISDIARTVAGIDDPKEAVDQVLKDPAMQLEFMKMVETNRFEFDRMYLADKQNARVMYGKHNEQADKIAHSVMRFNVIYVILVALAQILAITLTDLPESAVVVIGNVCGWIIKGLLDERIQVTGFYFGSSIGSKAKQ